MDRDELTAFRASGSEMLAYRWAAGVETDGNLSAWIRQTLNERAREMMEAQGKALAERDETFEPKGAEREHART